MNNIKERLMYLLNSEVFTKEIELIKNRQMKETVIEVLDLSPEIIQHIPASSTGKYHPEYSLGEGGLVRHVKAAVYIAFCLAQTETFRNLVINKFNDNDDSLAMVLENARDCVYASLILHDCQKPDASPQHHTRFAHPIIAAKLFAECAKNHMINRFDKGWVNTIAQCIASHMGEFNTSSRDGDTVLPKPMTTIESFVHMCDYLASRRFLDFNFEKFYANYPELKKE